MSPCRSVLFVEADDIEKISAALSSEADAVIVDLEDMVAVSRKPFARSQLEAVRSHSHKGLLYIRVNTLRSSYCYDDLLAAVGNGLDGIVAPKVESPEDIAILDWMLTQCETRQGLEKSSIELFPIIETAKAFQNIETIAVRKYERFRKVAFGAVDLTLDIGLRTNRDELELSGMRLRFVTACRAGLLDPPIDAIWIDLKDEDGLRDSTRRALDYGFGGKFCSSIQQARVVNEMYSPTASELEIAGRIVAAFDAATAEGKGSIEFEGRLIDLPVAQAARRTLARKSN